MYLPATSARIFLLISLPGIRRNTVSGGTDYKSAPAEKDINTNFPPNDPLTAWASSGIYWISIIAFSTLLYKYYEKPMMDLRDKWGEIKAEPSSPADSKG